MPTISRHPTPLRTAPEAPRSEPVTPTSTTTPKTWHALALLRSARACCGFRARRTGHWRNTRRGDALCQATAGGGPRAETSFGPTRSFSIASAALDSAAIGTSVAHILFDVGRTL